MKKNNELKPEPGWTDVDPFPNFSHGQSFVSGDPKSERLRVNYFKRDSDGALVGKVWFGPEASGPPGHAHGGSMAAVLDEAMGSAAWIAGHSVLAASITTHFRKMLPLGTEAVIEAFVERTENKKVFVRSKLSDGAKTIYAEGEGLYIKISAEQVKELMSALKK